MSFYKKKPKEIILGSSILLIYVFWAILWISYKYIYKGTFLVPYNPEINMQNELSLPFTNGLILGGDLLGRSILEVLSAGLVYSLTIAIIVTISTTSIGVILGYLAIRSGPVLRLIVDILINLIFIFPSILIAILIMAATGQSIKGLIFALIITGWSGYAKIARGETKRVLGLSYVEGARAIGIGEIRLFFKIIIPAIMPIMIVNMVLGISGVIISESALGFLGLGGSPYSWGALLSSSKTVLLEAPHIAIILSITLSGLIIGLNLLGDGLRDYLDPNN